MSYSKVVLVGRFTADPEIKSIKEGVEVALFTIAVNDHADQVSFIECKAWRQTAKMIQMYCKKGMRVTVEGKLQQDRWEDAEGRKRSKLYVLVTMVHFVDGKQKDEQQPVNDDPFGDLGF